MGPVITLYILGGCVGLAAVLFIIMIALSVARPPRLRPLSIDSPPLQRMIRALTPAPVDWSAPPALAAAPRAVSRPIYPVRRSRKLRWFFAGLLVIVVLAAGAVIAVPSILDVPCDDYDWFGAGAAQVIRDCAWQANTAVADFIARLAS